VLAAATVVLAAGRELRSRLQPARCAGDSEARSASGSRRQGRRRLPLWVPPRPHRNRTSRLPSLVGRLRRPTPSRGAVRGL